MLMRTVLAAAAHNRYSSPPAAARLDTWDFRSFAEEDSVNRRLIGLLMSVQISPR